MSLQDASGTCRQLQGHILRSQVKATCIRAAQQRPRRPSRHQSAVCEVLPDSRAFCAKPRLHRAGKRNASATALSNDWAEKLKSLDSFEEVSTFCLHILAECSRQPQTLRCCTTSSANALKHFPALLEPLTHAMSIQCLNTSPWPASHAQS